MALKAPALEARRLAAGYGRKAIVSDVDITVPPHHMVCVIGPNGAGKSTVLKAILGLNRVFAGQILVDDVDVTGLPTHKRVARGIGYVPQGRQVFPDLSVQDNLRMGGYLLDDRELVAERIEEMYRLFPRLRERRSELGRRLSGGEQQMLAMARALVAEPSVVILDEPTIGLAPIAVALVLEQLERMRDAGISTLMVEQNATLALGVCDGGYVVDHGTCGPFRSSAALLGSADVRRIYLGGVEEAPTPDAAEP